MLFHKPLEERQRVGLAEVVLAGRDHVDEFGPVAVAGVVLVLGLVAGHGCFDRWLPAPSLLSSGCPLAAKP